MRASNIGSQHDRFPRFCSTSMCCERFKHWLPTQAFTPILFDIYVLREIQKIWLPTRACTPILLDIYVLREIQSLAPNTSVYPDLVRHLCAMRASNIGSQHECLPRSCSTSMCCERFKHWLPTQAFTPILFDIHVLREIQTLAPNTDLVQHLCVARDPNIGSQHKRLPRFCLRRPFLVFKLLGVPSD